MANKQVEACGEELASTSIWLRSPEPQEDLQANSIDRSSLQWSDRSLPVRPGDWRRVAAAKTDGTPVVPPDDGVFNDNIDDVHSSLSSACNTPVSQASGGEASFRLGSTPRVPKLGAPAGSDDGELSTPGSCGYTSPDINFAIPVASSVMHSNNNPLFVHRPSPSMDRDDVVKALVLSPHASPSPMVRLPRRTFESGWSSSTGSATRSVSLTLRGDRAAPAHPSSQATKSVSGPMLPGAPPLSSSPVASGTVLQDIPLVSSPLLAYGSKSPGTKLDLETPRRSIKGLAAALSGARTGVSGGSDAAQGTTPCSGAVSLSVSARSAAAAVATPGSSAVRSSPARTANPAVPSVSKGADGNSPASAVMTFGEHQHDVDDVSGPGRAVDQTPRRSAHSPLRGRADGVKQDTGGKRQKQVLQELMHGSQGPSVKAVSEQGRQRSKRSGANVLPLASWAILVVTLVAIVSFVKSPVPSPRSQAPGVVKMGPVCFRERYPSEHPPTAWKASSQPALQPAEPVKPVSTASASSAQFTATDSAFQVPFCWRKQPNCHALDDLLQFASRIIVQATVTAPPKPLVVSRAVPFCWAKQPNCHAADGLLSFSQGSGTRAIPISEPVAAAPDAACAQSLGVLILEVQNSDQPATGNLDGKTAEADSADTLGRTDAFVGSVLVSSGPEEETLVADALPAVISSPPITSLDQPSEKLSGAELVDGAVYASGYQGPASPDSDLLAYIVSTEAAEAASVNGVSAGPGIDFEGGINEGTSHGADNNGLTSSNAKPYGVQDSPDAAANEQLSVPVQGAAIQGAEGYSPMTSVEVSSVDTAGQPAADPGAAVIDRDEVPSGLFVRRWYGWTLPHLLASAVLACLTGAMLGWLIRRWQPRPEEHHPAAQVQSTADLNPLPMTLGTPGRCLRLKAGVRSAGHAKRESHAIVQQTPGAESFVFIGNKLTYVEAAIE